MNNSLARTSCRWRSRSVYRMDSSFVSYVCFIAVCFVNTRYWFVIACIAMFSIHGILFLWHLFSHSQWQLHVRMLVLSARFSSAAFQRWLHQLFIIILTTKTKTFMFMMLSSVSAIICIQPTHSNLLWAPAEPGENPPLRSASEWNFSACDEMTNSNLRTWISTVWLQW